MAFFPRTYPVIERALLPDVAPRAGRPDVRGRIKEADLPKVKEHEKLELDSGHLPGIELMEIVRDDDSVYYEAVTGPNCNHGCAACRGEIADDTREFGTGAIGLFSNTAEGELERLREAMRKFAEEMNDGIRLVKAAREATQLPAETVPVAKLSDGETKPWQCTSCGSFTYWHFADPPPGLTQEMKDRNPDLCAPCTITKES